MASENDKQNTPFESGSDVNWRVIVGIVLLALSLIFILQNTEKVRIDFLFFDFTVGMWLGLLITFILGALVGWGLHMAWRRRKKNPE